VVQHDSPISLRLLQWAGFPVALAILGVVATISYTRVRQFQTDVYWRGQTTQALEHIERIQTALLGADAMRRAYRLSHDSSDLDQMESRIASASWELYAALELTQDNPGQQARLQELRPMMTEHVEVLLDLPTWDELDAKTRDDQRARQARGSDLTKRLGIAIDAIRGEQVRLLAEREGQTLKSSAATQATLLYGSGLGILLVVLLYGSLALENRERLRVQRELGRANALFNGVVEGTTDVISVKDAQGRYILINSAGCRILGRARADVLGKTDRELLTGGTGESIMARDQEVLRGGVTITFEQVASVDDRTWIFDATKGPCFGPTGEVIGLIAVSRDVSERKQLEAKIAEQNVERGEIILRLQRQSEELAAMGETLRAQAIRDPLTRLYNRRFMDETLLRELARVTRKGAPLSVVLVDIDHFKRLNDTAGHPAGDAVLKRVARQLMSSVRREDVACRYGGEEFVLILPELPVGGAAERAEHLRREIEASIEAISDTVGPMTASFGVACFPSNGATGEELLAAADAALYRAKKSGRNRVVVAEPSATHPAVAV
jgi:diguanylate cyclase (GGDEF)-like protein/PAS domain S-box-containing protein